MPEINNHYSISSSWNGAKLRENNLLKSNNESNVKVIGFLMNCQAKWKKFALTLGQIFEKNHQL